MTIKLLMSLALTSVITLSGCGGSSDSGEVPITPEPQPPEQLTLSITGFLSLDLSAKTPVTLTVGDNTYNTSSTEANSYQFNITYKDTDLHNNDWVKITAEGVNQEQHIVFINHIGTWDKVIELSGNDGLLDSTESKKLNLTSMSTTHYLLANEANREIATDEALIDAETKVLSDELGRYSGFMQLLIDDNQYGVATGETTISTLQAEDTLEKSFDLYQKTTRVDNNDLNEAIAQVSKDPLNIDEINPQEFIGLNIFTYDIYQDYVANSGLTIDLSDDGKAVISGLYDTYYQYFQDYISTWLVEGNVINITIPSETAHSSMVSEYLDERQIAERWGQETIDKLLALNDNLAGPEWDVLYTPSLIEVIQTGENQKPFATLIITQKVELDVIGMGLNWQGELPSVIEVQSKSQSWHLPKHTQSILSDKVTGDWALPIPTELDYIDGIEGNLELFISHSLLSLNSDNTFAYNNQALGQWQQKNGKIVLTFDNGTVISYLPYAEKNGLMSTHITTVIDGMSHTEIAWIAKSNIQTITSLETELLSPLPMFLDNGINDYRAIYWENNQLVSDALYGYQGYANGDFHRIDEDFDYDENGEQGEGYFAADKGWSWQRKNEQTLSWTQNYSSLIRYRDWQIVASDNGDNFIVIEHEYREQDNDNDGEFDEEGFIIPPRLNILTITDLSDWPEQYQRALEKGTLN